MKKKFDFLNALPADMQCQRQRPECYADLASADSGSTESRLMVLSKMADNIKSLLSDEFHFSNLLGGAGGDSVSDNLDNLVGDLLELGHSVYDEPLSEFIHLYSHFYFCSVFYLLVACNKADWHLSNIVKLADCCNCDETELMFCPLDADGNPIFSEFKNLNIFYLILTDFFEQDIPPQHEKFAAACKQHFDAFDSYYRKYGYKRPFSYMVKYSVENYMSSHRSRLFTDPRAFAQATLLLDETIATLDSILSGEEEGPFFEHFQETISQIDTTDSSSI